MQVKSGLLYSKFLTLWWESSDRFMGEYNYINNTYITQYIKYVYVLGECGCLSRDGGMAMSGWGGGGHRWC